MNKCIWKRTWRLQEDSQRRGVVDYGWTNPETKEEVWDKDPRGRKGNTCPNCGVFPKEHGEV